MGFYGSGFFDSGYFLSGFFGPSSSVVVEATGLGSAGYSRIA